MVAAACVAALLRTAAARAQDVTGCEALARSWAERCPALRDRCVRGVLCPPRSSVIDVGCSDAERLRVEVSPPSPRAFRRVGAVSASPVGDFPDWASAPPGPRESFARVVSCLERDASLLPAFAVPSPTHAAPRPRPRSAVPWCLLGGALASLATAMFALRHRRRDEVARHLGSMLALTVATWWTHRAIAPAGSFHQNGQGPLWIAFALEPDGRGSPYGPGYWELFHALGALPGHDPEHWIRGAQSIVGAVVPAALWVVARAAGTDVRASWGVALVAATSPVLARLAQSESYYATCGALLAFAAATLSLGALDARPDRARFALSVVGAGLLVAQSARVNPVCWVPAACIPMVLVARPDAGRARWMLALTATVGVAALVAATSAASMRAVLRGSLGARWLPQALVLATHDLARVALMALVCAAVVWASSRRMSASARLAAMGAVGASLVVTRLVSVEAAVVQRAFASLWAAPVVALVAGTLAGLRRGAVRVAAAVAVIALALIGAVVTRRADVTLATDALECAWAEQWRHTLPPNAVVVYPGQGRTYVLTLPLYGAGSPVPIEPWVLTGEQPIPRALPVSAAPTYYYASSLCSTREAGDVCAAMARAYRLTEIASRVLPARSSDVDLRFEVPAVPVTLYRVDGAR